MRIATLYIVYVDGTPEVVHVATDDDVAAEDVAASVCRGYEKGYIYLERVNEHDVTDKHHAVLNLTQVRGISILHVEDVDTGGGVR